MEYKAIDLGLPSGLKWSDRNVGAGKETDYGLYFQWGDTVGYTDASHSTWATCPGNGGNSTYDEDSILAWDDENLLNGVLKPGVDAATVSMGSRWRMPTIEDFAELFEYTNYEYTKIDGVIGGKFISKADTSKYIFLPFAGGAAGDLFIYQGSQGYLWSSSVNLDILKGAYSVCYGGYSFADGGDYRYGALPVRGVC